MFLIVVKLLGILAHLKGNANAEAIKEDFRASLQFLLPFVLRQHREGF